MYLGIHYGSNIALVKVSYIGFGRGYGIQICHAKLQHSDGFWSMVHYQWVNGSRGKIRRNVINVGYNSKISFMLYGNVVSPNRYGKEF